MQRSQTVIRVCVPVDVDPVGCDATFNATLNAAATSMGVNVYFDCRVGFNVPTCSQARFCFGVRRAHASRCPSAHTHRPTRRLAPPEYSPTSSFSPTDG